MFTVSIQYILKGIILNEPHEVADHPRLPMERIHEAAEVHSFLQHTATQAAASEKRLARNAPICKLYIPEASKQEHGTWIQISYIKIKRFKKK